MVTHFYCANTKNFKYLLGVFSPCFLFSNYYTRHKFFFFFSFSRSSLSLYVIHQGWVTTMGWVREIKRVEGEVRVLGLTEEGDDGFVEAFLQRRLQDFLHLCCRLPSSLSFTYSKLSLPPSSLLLLCNNLLQSCSQSVLPPINHNFSSTPSLIFCGGCIYSDDIF